MIPRANYKLKLTRDAETISEINVETFYTIFPNALSTKIFKQLKMSSQKYVQTDANLYRQLSLAGT